MPYTELTLTNDIDMNVHHALELTDWIRGDLERQNSTVFLLRHQIDLHQSLVMSH